MKSRTRAIVMGLLAAINQAWGAATVAINNYSSLMPVYAAGALDPIQGTFPVIPVTEGLWGELIVFGQPVLPIGQDSSIFGFSKEGFFDAGYGIIPGLPDPKGPVEFTLRVWRGLEGWDYATERGSLTWSQPVGSWNPDSQPPQPITGPSLQISSPIYLFVPEPSSWALMILGLGMVGVALWRRRGKHSSADYPWEHDKHNR